jgi:predicted TIM-barrel fold metal-dependent hydrolase
MLDAIVADPTRHRGVAIVDDTVRDRELQALHEAGVRGVRFNFVRHLGGSPDPLVFSRVLARIKPLGWHVVLHLDAADIESLSDMMAALPVPFVVDHMGRVDSSFGLDQAPFRALLALAKRETCWIKVSGCERISKPPYEAAIPFARALMYASPRRVLWGTDFPHPNLAVQADEADLVDLLPRIAETEAQRWLLLVDNPETLYGFAR